ncbi:HNH endonuclease [Cytophaga sp. FL35]|uniref:HNH endonuclease n=1 Tax=Cytophaga sp. FL35 TaxID=1904456 RepID=UPI001CA451B4|nr:HNH endonuclease [Cytophaga sp. FL35]
MRNPRWHRDELILTLNVYFENDSSTFISSNKNIIELSGILNKLPIHSLQLRKSDFRNVNGVAMKLGNFTAIDPSNDSKGLTSFSKNDEKIFFEFVDNKTELKRISDLIIESIKQKETIEKLYEIEEETDNLVKEGFEGEVLYKLHKVRERNIKLNESKKNQTLKETGKLECEVCGFDFFHTYGELGKGFIECHHTRPLSTYQSEQITKIKDLSLVCSNCHRMLHRSRPNMSIETLKSKLRANRQLNT